MKNPLHLPLSGLMLIALILFAFNPEIFAQEKETQKDIKIKIIKKENGETTVIDKVISTEDEKELEEILKEYGVEPEMSVPGENEEVEIIIKKKKSGEQNEKVIEMERVMEPPVMGIKTFLGVYLEQPSEEKAKELKLPLTNGILITEVVEGSAAEKAGLKTGDFVTKVGNNEIKSSQQFREVIGSYNPGDEVKITYIRNGKEESVNATLGNRKVAVERFYGPEDFHWDAGTPHGFGMCDPEANNRPFLGIAPGNPDTEQKEGIKVGRVIENSTAAETGLKEGDVILEVNDAAVNNIDELKEAMSRTKIGEEVKVEFTRDGKKMKETTTVKGKPFSAERDMQWYGEKMERCIDKMNQQIEEGLEINKELLKENIEKTIEKMELQLKNLERKLQDLDKNEAGGNEKEITITIENVDASKTSPLKELQVDNLSFSPNPNDGKFSLSFDLSQKEKTTVKIFDINNKEIYSETLNKFSGQYENKLDISDNPKGIYFLQISQGDKTLNKKIVIQ